MAKSQIRQNLTTNLLEKTSGSNTQKFRYPFWRNIHRPFRCRQTWLLFEPDVTIFCLGKTKVNFAIFSSKFRTLKYHVFNIGNIWLNKHFFSSGREKMFSKLYELHSKRWNFYGLKKIGISCWRIQKWIESWRISNLNLHILQLF